MPHYAMLPGEPDAGGTSIRELWESLRRQRLVIVAATVVTLLLAGAFILLMPPLYESEATLRILGREQGSPILAELPELADLVLPGAQGSEIETEMGVLRSRRIAEEVVTSLGLQVELLSPNVPRDSVLRVLSAPPNLEEADFEIFRLADGSYEVEGDEGRTRVELGQAIHLGSIEIALTPEVAALDADEFRVRVRPFHETVEQLRETFSVEQQAGRSELVEISYRSQDRLLAADVVESAVAAYLDYKEATDNTELRQRVETLQEQVATYASQLEVAENELRDFREEFRIVDPVEQAEQQVGMIAAIRTEREEAMIEREALLMTLDEIERAGPSDDLARQLAAFPTFITNAGVQSILQSLTEAENARSSLLVLRTPENLDVQRLDDRIAELELQIQRMVTSYLGNLENVIASADTTLARFGAAVEALPQQELEYARLERQQRLLDEIYLTLQARLEEASVQYATQPDEVLVVDSPLLPVEPVWPRPMITLALAAVLGLMIGMMLSVGREAVDTTVRSQWEAEAVTGIPVVGAIPRLSRRREREGWGLPGRLPRLISPESRYRSGNHSLVSSGGSEAIDAFRSIPATIGGRPEIGMMPQVVLITSALDGDGKSVTAANLALVLAQSGHRTLLIDADLRNATLHDIMGGSNAVGLADILTGNADLAHAVQDLALPNAISMGFLAAGTSGPHAPNQINSQRVREALLSFRSEYDRIVIDAPAMLRHAEVAVLGAMADSVLLVVRSGATDKDALRQVAVRLERMQIPVAGMILNDVDDRFGWIRSGTFAAAGNGGPG